MDENSKKGLEALKAEYNVCLDGYKYRDAAVPTEFFQLIQLFVTFNAIMLAFSQFATIEDKKYSIAIIALIGATGFLAMLAFVLDIESNLSCKSALRKRCQELEIELEKEEFPIGYWKAIKEREKYLVERIIKGSPGIQEIITKHGDYIVMASRFLIGIWVVNILYFVFIR